jgi:hypothetical protein
MIWNPPNSPDLNPLEKLWDIVMTKGKLRMFELACGMHGASRKFGSGDLVVCLRHARLTSKAYTDILMH